jgi:hypothetical protein
MLALLSTTIQVTRSLLTFRDITDLMSYKFTLNVNNLSINYHR